MECQIGTLSGLLYESVILLYEGRLFHYELIQTETVWENRCILSVK